MRKKNKFIYIISGFGIAILLSLIISLTFVLTGVVQFDHEIPDWVWDLEDLSGSLEENLPDWDFDNLPDDVKEKLLEYLKKNLTKEDLDQDTFEKLLSNSVLILTQGAEKVYDGTPLTCSFWFSPNQSIVTNNGHILEVSPYGSQTLVGSSKNIASYKIVTEHGDDVTEDYSVIIISGTLTVTDGTTESKDPYGFGLGSYDGGTDGLGLSDIMLGAVAALASGDLLSDSKALEDSFLQGDILRVRSDTSGYIYLRNTNFGDYNYKGEGFSEAVPYLKNGVNDVFNSTSDCLAIGTNRIAISVIAPNLNSYFLPYYATDKYNLKDDVAIYDFQKEYYVNFKNYDYLTSEITLSSKDAGDYNFFVHNNYLKIDPELKEELLALTDYFTSSDKDLIKDIVSYVRQAATYNLEFEPFPDGEDKILYFLKEGKEGICQHFASAATMIFRAYGIPARYTIGFLARTEANKFVRVTSKEAHAWVEIYLDDIGWVQVEVTGGGYMPTGGTNDGLLPPDFSGGQSAEFGGTLIADAPIDVGDTEILSLVADNDGLYYLRDKSFGDYNGKGFENAAVYAYSFGGIDSVFNPVVYAINGKESNLHIKILVDGVENMLLTYYPTGLYHLESDATVKSDLKEYDVPFISYDYLYDIAPTARLDLSAYNGFVKNTYLKIDPQLKEELLALTDYFNTSGKDLVRDIANYVRQAATYNLEFEPFPDDADVITYFLKDGKEGICQHFAAAATMIYRAYGIPARYTVGYVVAAHDKEEVLVDQSCAHAWVEIYLENIGWIQVEVTAADGVPEYRRTIKIFNDKNSKVYDGTPLEVDLDNLVINDSQLKDGHVLIQDLDYLPSITNVSESDKVFNAPNFRIIDTTLDDENNDVTDQYIFDYSGCETLEIKSCPISVTVTGSKNYDSTATVLEDDLYHYIEREDGGEGLFGNDELILSFGDLIGYGDNDGTDFGDYYYWNVSGAAGKFNFDARIFDKGKDVTDNYRITIGPESQYIVDKRSININTESITWLYDGEEHYCDKFSVFTLADNDVADVCDYPTLSDGKKQNNLTIDIYRKDSYKSKEYNYDITYDFGWLEVTKIIKVFSDDQQYVYDGMWHFGEYTAEIPDGFNVEFGKKTIKNVGEEKNIPYNVTIWNRQNEVVTGFYEFDYSGCEDKKLVIYKRDITIKTDSLSKFYDGTPLTNGSAPLLIGGYGLAKGDIISDPEFNGFQTNIGKSNNSISGGKESITIFNSDNLEVTENYDISFSVGTLEITKRKLNVTSLNAEKIYDGEALEGGDYSFEGLLEGDKATSYNNASIFDVGIINNVPTELVIKDKNGSGNDVTERYEVDYSKCGTLKVKKRKIYVTSSGDIIYDYDDGKEHIGGGYGVLASDAASGFVGTDHVISYDPAEITEVGTIKNLPKSVSITNEKNYEIDYTNCTGNLTLNGLMIRVFNKAAKFVYDGESHFGEYTFEGFEDGDYIDDTCYIPSSLKNVGITYNHKPKDIKVKDSFGNEVPGKYSFNYDGCVNSLEITKCNIEIRLSGEKEYDGSKVVDNSSLSYEIYIGGKPSALYNGETVEIIAYLDSSDVGERNFESVYYSTNLNINYDVTPKYCGFAIKPREISVYTGDYETIYNGEKQIGSGVYSQKLVNSHVISAIFVDEGHISVGQYENKIEPTSVVIKDSFQNDVTANYKVTGCEFGTFTITRRTVKVTVINAVSEKQYDGTSLEGAYKFDGLVVGHEASCLPASITDPGVIYNIPTELKVVAGSEVVTNNYDFDLSDCASKQLSISRIIIILTSGDIEKIYDGSPIQGNCSATDNPLEESGYIMTLRQRTLTDRGVAENKAEVTVKKDGVNVTKKYYEIRYGACGQITVKQRPITITSASGSKKYDGEELRIDSYEIGGYGLANGHNLKAEFFDGLTEVGYIENIIDINKITDKNGKDVTDNYNITIKYGTLVVEPPTDS